MRSQARFRGLDSKIDEIKIITQFGAVAQLGERLTGSQKVWGSIPHSSTFILLDLQKIQHLPNSPIVQFYSFTTNLGPGMIGESTGTFQVEISDSM